MNLITKIGLGIVGLALLTNISGRILRHCDYEKNNLSINFKNSAASSEIETIEMLEKYSKRENYLSYMMVSSYVVGALGSSIALGAGKKVRLDIQIG